MHSLRDHAHAHNSIFAFTALRPRIERELDGHGWLVLLHEHGWLVGDRRQALAEFDALERIERRGRA